MKEVNIRNNTGLKVYINGIPDLKQIPKDIADIFIRSMAEKAEEFIQKRKTGKNLNDKE